MGVKVDLWTDDQGCYSNSSNLICLEWVRDASRHGACFAMSIRVFGSGEFCGKP